MRKFAFTLVTVLVLASLALSACGQIGGGTKLTQKCTPEAAGVALLAASKGWAAPLAFPLDLPAALAGSDFKIGVVTDVGKVTDGTFNQLAYEGAVKAAQETGATLNYIETSSSDDYQKNLETFANEDYNHIIAVGYLIMDVVKTLAPKYPDVHWTIVDGTYDPVLPNAHGLIFREDNSGFLAGMLAGCMTKSGTVGIVGGMEIPPVIKFRNGYENGVAFVCPDCKVVGVYIDSFLDPARGKAAAESQIAEGADVIFGAGGPTGSGGILGAAQQGVWVIGVDQDEYLTTFKNGAEKGADKILSSAMKRVDVGVYTSVMQTINGNFVGGTLLFDAANDGVGFAPYHDAESAVPQGVKDLLSAALAKLKDGTLGTGVDPATGEKISK